MSMRNKVKKGIEWEMKKKWMIWTKSFRWGNEWVWALYKENEWMNINGYAWKVMRNETIWKRLFFNEKYKINR